MAAGKRPPTFLESVLSVAPLDRPAAAWAFVRYTGVLPEDAEADFGLVRAHEINRPPPHERPLPKRIAVSIADRALPKGGQPDPGFMRAKALWKDWEANGFKAPAYIPRWPNHSGSPTTKADTFPSPPEAIGEVLSATTNVHDGRVQRDYPASIFFAIVIGGAPGALLGFITAQFTGWPDVPFTTGSAVVASLIAYAVHVARSTRSYVTWVGTEGLATTTDGKDLVFRFARAVKLDVVLTDVAGEAVEKRAVFTWLDAKNRIVHRARAVLPEDLTVLPETAAAHFVLASEQAWKAFENRDDR